VVSTDVKKAYIASLVDTSHTMCVNKAERAQNISHRNNKKQHLPWGFTSQAKSVLKGAM